MPRSSFPIELGLLCPKTGDKNWVALHSKKKSIRMASNEGRRGAVCRNRSGGQKGLKVGRQGGRRADSSSRSPPLARTAHAHCGVVQQELANSRRLSGFPSAAAPSERASRTRGEGVEREEIDLFSPFSLRASRFVDCHGGRGLPILVRCSPTPSFLNSQIIHRNLGCLQLNRQELCFVIPRHRASGVRIYDTGAITRRLPLFARIQSSLD